MAKIKATLLYVLDADTIEVQSQTGIIRTRARWIDAPETRKSGEVPRNEADLNQWEWGERSRAYLEAMLQGKQLVINTYSLDQYGRTLADWYAGIEPVRTTRSNNVQAKLCEFGMAVDMLPFQRYNLTSSDITSYVAILRGQLNAHKKKLGVWNDPVFLLPSQWRATRV